MSPRRRTILFTLLAIAVLVTAFISGAWTESRTQLLSVDVPANARADFDLMAEAWNLIQKDYVDRSAVQPQPMTYGAISGMVASLGDTGHSVFLSPEMVKEEQDLTQGHFEGVGLEVQVKNGQIVIVAPIDGSPAKKAGLKPGEIITGVDGQDIKGLTLGQVVQKIMGPAGTSVTLTIEDPRTGQTNDVKLQRATIEIQNVTWHMLPGTRVVHLRIAAFSKGVTQDLQQALQDIQGQDYDGLILDLRSNPGGLLDEAVGVSSEFLSSGYVLKVRNAQGEITPIAVLPGGTATEVKMVALINGGTASAAEIVSGALQSAQRAVLIGETTFGTGTVLNQFPLSDGSALMLATEEWLTPDGKSIWHNGITPDVQVTLPAGASPLVPEEEAGMTASQLAATDDAQLLQAIQSLTGAPGS
ncbi:MAG: S41 family peptidase [Anaerolineales bacterium]|jgi:carboxyl-terminal processing protease